jgi:hypothetical protein
MRNIETNVGHFRTLRDMASFNEKDGIKDHSVCYNIEDGNYYKIHSLLTRNIETGGWRKADDEIFSKLP